AAARRVAIGSYLPSLFLISSASWSDQTTLGTAGATPGLNPAGAMNTYGAGFVAALDVFTGGRRGAQRSYAEAISQAAGAGSVRPACGRQRLGRCRPADHARARAARAQRLGAARAGTGGRPRGRAGPGVGECRRCRRAGLEEPIPPDHLTRGGLQLGEPVECP